MTDVPLPDELVRSRSHQTWCLCVATCCAAVAIGALAVALGRSSRAPQIALAIVLVLLAAAAVRWSRACLIFGYSRQVLIVHNPLRTYVLPWAEVRGFEVRDSVFGSPQTGAHRSLVKLIRTDGSRLTCVGACALGRTKAQDMTGRLNDAFQRRTWTRQAGST